MIYGAILFLLLSCLIAVGAFLAYRRQPIRSIYATAILMGMFYWYVLPGSIFLAGMAAGQRDLYLLQDRRAVTAAILIVLISLALMLVLPRLFSGERLECRGVSSGTIRSVRNLARANLLVACVFFVTSFYQFGPAIMLKLLQGGSTARLLMNFQNQSMGVTQSLLSLMQIVITFTSLFCIGLLLIARKSSTGSFFLSLVVIVILLVSTGTRSILLMAVFVMFMCFFYRPTSQTPKTSLLVVKYRRLPSIALNFLVGALSISVMIARFRESPSELEELLLSSISSHNDMFRELIFTLGSDSSTDGLSAFLLTPVSFAMPSFLGFEKSIPMHLVEFNSKRAGIDLILGEGNVFPGLLGDAYLLTGVFAPLLVVCLTAVIFSAFNCIIFRDKTDPIRVSLLISLLAHFFISIRNVQGSLLIVLLLAFVIHAFLGGSKRRRF